MKQFITENLKFIFYVTLKVIIKVITFLLLIFDDILVIGGLICLNIGLYNTLTEYQLMEFYFILIGIEIFVIFYFRVKEQRTETIKEEVK